jgi:FdhD protein
LSQAQAPLTCEVSAIDEHGEHISVFIPAERALTVYIDKRELVTLMTLGAHPELLVLGYLRNQRLVKSIEDIESITVDWDVGAAAVKTKSGIADIEEKTSKRVVTTGCGQGSVFGGLMDEVDQIKLPPGASIAQSQLYALVNTIRLKETTYKSAGSVHACALFDATGSEPEMLLFVEDVGRHNAIDTIAGWMWVNMAPALVAARTALDVPAQHAQALVAVQTSAGGFGAAALSPEGALRLQSGKAASAAPAGKDSCGSQHLVFYTTGRLTSEMVIKSAQMGVPIVVSRSGITQMGHQVAQSVGLCAIGRATNKRFLCYTSSHRLILEPGLAGIKPEVVKSA